MDVEISLAPLLAVALVVLVCQVAVAVLQYLAGRKVGRTGRFYGKHHSFGTQPRGVSSRTRTPGVPRAWAVPPPIRHAAVGRGAEAAGRARRDEPPGQLGACPAWLLHGEGGFSGRGPGRVGAPARDRRARRPGAALALGLQFDKVSQFVERSLAERKYIKLEKQRDALVAERQKKGEAPGAPGQRAAQISRYVQPGLVTALCLWFWSQPVLRLPPALLWPLGFVLAKRGAVGVVVWAGLCHSVLAKAVKAAADSLGYAPPPAPPFNLLNYVMDSKNLGLLSSVLPRVLDVAGPMLKKYQAQAQAQAQE